MTKNLDTPVLKGLFEHKNKSEISFHMPGHKGKYIDEYKVLQENLLSFDVTELDDTDDLYNPKGFLKEALQKLSKERKSMQSIFLTNGSTVGILSSIMALTNINDKILIEEGCHKSVYNAIELNNLNPIILSTKYDENKIPLPTSEDRLLNTLKENPDVAAVVLSRPNYYGLCANIENLSRYCLENNIYLIIDEAHGSHLSYNKNLPKSAMELGASVSINSFHKTLPAFTQTSVLNLSKNLSLYDRKRVLAMVEKLQSSSPSYLMMASIDIARAYIEKNGEDKLKILEKNIEEFSKKIDSLDYISIFKDFKGYEYDFTRPILIYENPKELELYLQKNKIYIEMIGENSLVLVSTLMDERKDFDRLYLSLKNFKKTEEKLKTNYNQENLKTISVENGVLVPLSLSEGYTLQENIIPYPPGNIYLKKGDIIKKENIEYLENLISKGIHIYKDFYKDINFIYCKNN